MKIITILRSDLILLYNEIFAVGNDLFDLNTELIKMLFIKWGVIDEVL